MPFNIDFKNIHDQFGRLTIDRDNLIFQFIPASKNEEDYDAALTLRTLFSIFLDPVIDERERAALIDPYPMEDKRHGIDDHVVNNDRETPHFHLKFNKMVDFETVNRLLNALPPAVMAQFMSEACKGHILAAVKGYFHELKVDQMAFGLEQEYRLKKQLHFKEAVKWKKIEDKKGASKHASGCEGKRKATDVPFTLFPSIESSKKKPEERRESKRQKIR